MAIRGWDATLTRDLTRSLLVPFPGVRENELGEGAVGEFEAFDDVFEQGKGGDGVEKGVVPAAFGRELPNTGLEIAADAKGRE